MGKYRIYADRTATILEDYPTRNTGLNEVSELWYGDDGVSRYLQNWNVLPYRTLVNSGKIPATTASSIQSVYINFFGTYPVIESASTAPDTTIQCLYLTQRFVEGDGFEFGAGFETGITNWYSASVISSWVTSGGDFTGTAFTADLTAKQFVLSGEISDKTTLWTWINLNYLKTALKFSPEYEALTADTKRIRKFYTRHTNTIFEPFIDIVWNDSIKEDRIKIPINYSGNRLHLFIFRNGMLTDPQAINSVTISGQTFTTGITRLSQGIYYLPYTVSSNTINNSVFSDVWNVTYTGTFTGNITQYFTAVTFSAGDGWSTSQSISSNAYDISIPKLREEYVINDYVLIPVLFKQNYSTENLVLKNAQFRITIKDPITKDVLLPMYDWADLSYNTSENFFVIDTSWFITGQTYTIDIKYTDGMNTVQSEFNRKFVVR
jgi:hypothetical protein